MSGQIPRVYGDRPAKDFANTPLNMGMYTIVAHVYEIVVHVTEELQTESREPLSIPDYRQDVRISTYRLMKI